MSVDTDQPGNWAVGERPVSRCLGVHIIDGFDDSWPISAETRKNENDIEEQSRSDLWSWGRNRKCCRTRFCCRGAKVFLTGHTRAAVDAVAKDMGKAAEAADVDALDEQAIDKHLQSVIDSVGRVDISFNAVGIPDNRVLGLPLAEMDVKQFSLPLATYVTSYFLTARLAARRMALNKSGVIMTVSALPARMGSSMNGGYGPAQAAKEALTRDLSLEFARQGVRVVCLRPHGIPETSTMKEVFEIKGKPAGMAWEQFTSYLASTTHPKRVMTLDEVANVAAFVASDRASGLTGTTVNLTMGSLDD